MLRIQINSVRIWIQGFYAECESRSSSTRLLLTKNSKFCNQKQDSTIWAGKSLFISYWSFIKGAQVWDIRSLVFSWFLHHKVFMGRWFGGKNINLLFLFLRELSRIYVVSDAHAEHTSKELMRMLSMRISSWHVCSGYASGTDAYAQLVLKGLRSVHVLVPDAYAQCTHQFLTRMLSARISSSSWRIRYAQHTHKGRSICVRKSNFLIIFKVPK